MYIKLKVLAGARKETVVRKSEDHFDVSVREKAERNLANRRVVALMAGHFKVPAGKVRIVSGHQSPGKILSVDLGD